MNIRFGIPLLFLFISPLLVSGQKNLNNTVVLYNLVPVRVDLEKDGTIKQMYGADYNFLRGYTIVKPEVKEDKANAVQDPKGYYVVSTENFDISFNKNNAILSKESIESLDKSAENSFFNDHRILVHPYKDNGTNASKTLLKNRLNAVLTYLEIKGIPKEKIILSIEALERTDEDIKISFVK